MSNEALEMSEEAQGRTLKKQLRITQAVAISSLIGTVVLAARQLKTVTELHVGSARITEEGMAIGSVTVREAVFDVRAAKGAGAGFRVDNGGAMMGMASGTASLTLSVDRLRPQAAIVARGVVESELRFDTDTGALILIRRVDAEDLNSRQVVTELAGPIRQ